MPLPSTLTVIKIKGTFYKGDGSFEVGKVIVASEESLVSGSEVGIVSPVYAECALDENGYFELPVPATNDPQWAPANFTYQIKEMLSESQRSYRIAAPYDTPGGEIDLRIVSPVQNNPDPAMYVMVSQGNVPGGYARIDQSTGDIDPSVLPEGWNELVDAATVSVNAALGNKFRLVLGGNRTIANPTNLRNGQMLLFEFIQDNVGGRTVTFDSKFAFGTDILGVTLSTAPGRRDFVGAVYDEADDKLYVIAMTKGYS